MTPETLQLLSALCGHEIHDLADMSAAEIEAALNLLTMKREQNILSAIVDKCSEAIEYNVSRMEALVADLKQKVG